MADLRRETTGDRRQTTPEWHRVEVAVGRVAGKWREEGLSGTGTLRLSERALELVLGGGASVTAPYASLSGAIWRTGFLSIHGTAGILELEADQGLDLAWVLLVSLACPLPEFMRGLRALGSTRGGDDAVQSRFLTPLLHARRRLEDERDLESRLDSFNGRQLAERMRQAVEVLAAESFPKNAPDRRALEAELLDALEPLFARLHALHGVAERFRASAPEVRFEAWRSWVADVAAVFAEADRSWSAAVQLLPAVRPGVRRTRWWRRRVIALVAASLGAAASGGWL